MLKDLIRIANLLDKHGAFAEADSLDSVIASLTQDKPEWIANPNDGLAPNQVAAIGYSDITNEDVDRGLAIAKEDAKAKLRAMLGTASGAKISFNQEDEHYEPDMVETPKKVWVRAVAEKPSQGSQE